MQFLMEVKIQIMAVELMDWGIQVLLVTVIYFLMSFYLNMYKLM